MTATAAAPIDLGIERLVRIDEDLDAAASEDLRLRWEFGRGLLAARDGKGRLPNGFMRALVRRTGKTARELQYRAQFAERFPGEDELRNAVSQFGSWHQVVAVALKRPADGDDSTPAESVPVVEGTFSTFVADPPWRYGNTSTRGAAEDHYPTMSIPELCELDIVPTRAAEQAHLYLWTTAGHLPEAFEVMAAWGFTYKTYLVWVKPQMGMGNYFRVSSELVLFGIKGTMRTQSKSLMNWFEAKRGRHSAKPEKFYDLVTEASPGPYLELFARCRKDQQMFCRCSACRLGWTTWGNEA